MKTATINWPGRVSGDERKRGHREVVLLLLLMLLMVVVAAEMSSVLRQWAADDGLLLKS